MNMINFFIKHSFKTFLFFIILSFIMICVVDFGALLTRFGPIPLEAKIFYANNIEEFYINAVPFEIQMSTLSSGLRLLLPLVAIYGSFAFIDIKNTSLFMMISRKNNPTFEVIKYAILCSLFVSLAIFFGYLLYLLWTYFYFPQRGITTDFGSENYTLFRDLFNGSIDFFEKHYVLYYGLAGIFEFLLLPFEISVLTIIVSFCTKHNHRIIVIPYYIYLIETLIFEKRGVLLHFWDYSNYLNIPLLTFKVLLYHFVLICTLIILLINLIRKFRFNNQILID